MRDGGPPPDPGPTPAAASSELARAYAAGCEARGGFPFVPHLETLESVPDELCVPIKGLGSWPGGAAGLDLSVTGGEVPTSLQVESLLAALFPSDAEARAVPLWFLDLTGIELPVGTLGRIARAAEALPDPTSWQLRHLAFDVAGRAAVAEFAEFACWANARVLSRLEVLALGEGGRPRSPTGGEGEAGGAPASPATTLPALSWLTLWTLAPLRHLDLSGLPLAPAAVAQGARWLSAHRALGAGVGARESLEAARFALARGPGGGGAAPGEAAAQLGAELAGAAAACPGLLAVELRDAPLGGHAPTDRVVAAGEEGGAGDAGDATLGGPGARAPAPPSPTAAAVARAWMERLPGARAARPAGDATRLLLLPPPRGEAGGEVAWEAALEALERIEHVEHILPPPVTPTREQEGGDDGLRGGGAREARDGSLGAAIERPGRTGPGGGHPSLSLAPSRPPPPGLAALLRREARGQVRPGSGTPAGVRSELEAGALAPARQTPPPLPIRLRGASAGPSRAARGRPTAPYRRGGGTGDALPDFAVDLGGSSQGSGEGDSDGSEVGSDSERDSDAGGNGDGGDGGSVGDGGSGGDGERDAPAHGGHGSDGAGKGGPAGDGGEGGAASRPASDDPPSAAAAPDASQRFRLDDGQLDDDDVSAARWAREVPRAIRRISSACERRRAQTAFRLWHDMASDPWDRRRWVNPRSDRTDSPELLGLLNVLYDILEESGYRLDFPFPYRVPGGGKEALLRGGGGDEGGSRGGRRQEGGAARDRPNGRRATTGVRRLSTDSPVMDVDPGGSSSGGASPTARPRRRPACLAALSDSD